MESAFLGLILDSSVLIAAERSNLTSPQVIRSLRQSFGDSPIAISALTNAELGHGIYRANTAERAQNRHRRSRFTGCASGRH
jgi:predicted nucleic acid-binding protein